MASLTVCLERLRAAGAAEADLALLRAAHEEHRAAGHADPARAAADDWAAVLADEAEELTREIASARRGPLPKGQADLTGIEPANPTRQALADAERAKAAGREDAPGPEGFTLTGSTRAVDELEARGQQGLFDSPMASAQARIDRLERFLKTHDGEGFTAPSGVNGGSVVVTPSAKTPGRWQLTYFDKDGVPTYDSQEPSFRSAVEYAARDWRADLDRARFDSADSAADMTLFANPFAAPLAPVGRAIAAGPGRSAASVFVGGVGGATVSDHPIGSERWWLDVLMGGGLATVGLAALRGHGVTGTGGVLSQWQDRLGDALNKLPLIGNGPEALRTAKRAQRTEEQFIDRQVAEVGKFLKEHFTPAERGQMADLIEGRGIVRDFDIIHRQAAALDDLLSSVGTEMKRLGLLAEGVDTSGGYLHRYYSKHLGLDGEFRQAKAQQGLQGSYTIRRGTVEPFAPEYLSPGARAVADRVALLQGEEAALAKRLKRALADARRMPEMDGISVSNSRAQTLREALEQKRAELAEARAVELKEFTGTQNGKLARFLFAGDEVGRVDTGLRPVLLRRDTAAAVPLGTRAPEVPGVSDLAPTDRVWTIDGRGKDGKLVAHRDWTRAERDSWGEIRDAGYRLVRGMAEVSHDLSLARLWQRVADNPEWALRTGAPGDWVQVPDTRAMKGSPIKRYGALAGMYVRKDVWAGLRNYGRSPLGSSPVARTYLSALNRWKLWSTVYNPKTHWNNVWSNTMMLWNAGYKMRSIATGIAEMARGEASPLWREARDGGMFGTDWSSSLLARDGSGAKAALTELAQALREQPDIPDAVVATDAFMRFKEWWIGSRNSVAEAQGAWRSGAALARVLADPVLGAGRLAKRPIDAVAGFAQRLYRAEDELFKMAVFAAERDAGKSVEEAVDAAHRFFFDYSDLPEGVRWVRDLPIGSPFISYTWLAMPAVVRTIIEHPERVLALAAAVEAMNYVGVATTTEMGPGEYWGTQAAEDRLRPGWESGRALFGAKNSINVAFMDSYLLSLARMYPFGNPFVGEAGGDKPGAMPGPLAAWGPDVFGSNPIARVPWDLATNKDWKGAPIWQEGDPDAVKQRAALNYLYQAVVPKNLLTPGGYDQQKILEGLANDVRTARARGEEPPALVGQTVAFANAVAEALGGMQFTGENRAGQEASTRDALLGSVGIKLRPDDLETSAGFRQRAVVRDLRAHEQAMRKPARLGAEGKITEGQRDEWMDAIRGDMTEERTRLDEINEAKALMRRQGRMQ